MRVCRSDILGRYHRGIQASKSPSPMRIWAYSFRMKAYYNRVLRLGIRLHSPPNKWW